MLQMKFLLVSETFAGVAKNYSKIWILVGIVFILLLMIVLVWRKYSKDPTWLIEKILAIKMFFFGNESEESIDEKTINDAIETAGYIYDPVKDLFYSRKNAWQRKMGYCRLYDEASATFGMIIDCEPIYFEYEDKKWLIEFWKGQYDLTIGCEIGIYVADGGELDIADTFRGTFYQCASDKYLMEMRFELWKNQRILFSRQDKHWWLTGFRVGEFSEPSELVMNIMIKLKSKPMRDAFVKGLLAAGYLEKEIMVKGNSVSLVYDTPKTSQPMTRTKLTDEITQQKNKLLCDYYQFITKPYQRFPEKINAIRRQAPWLYKMILNLGKGEQFFQIYEKLKEHLNEE